jgi:hypothetical protein
MTEGEVSYECDDFIRLNSPVGRCSVGGIANLIRATTNKAQRKGEDHRFPAAVNAMRASARRVACVLALAM